MSTTDNMSVAERLFALANEVAQRELEVHAREVLSHTPQLVTYIQAMGIAGFYTKNGSTDANDRQISPYTRTRIHLWRVNSLNRFNAMFESRFSPVRLDKRDGKITRTTEW